MSTPDLDPDAGVKAISFTATAYRDVYPAIDPRHRPELSQAGRVVIITGSSRGIGQLGFATSFAHAKAAAIVLIGRSSDALAKTESLVNKLNPETQVLCIPLDVTDKNGVDTAFEQIVTRFGVPHVLINNAGTLDSLEPIAEVDIDRWWRTQEVNVKGTFLMTKAFLKATGSNPAAPTTIINMTSAASQGTPPGMNSYSPAKMAVTKLTLYISQEHPTITCVALDPGIVATDMGCSVPYLAPFMHDTAELSGGTAVWLCSGDKAYLSGRYVSVNWDLEEVERRKEEILKDSRLLTFCLKGDFGGPDVTVHKYN
ncbi:hypothetical protein N7462_002146 [Penicillium macrosclerotiorum]|uniref:uncharacterized protein n=1 Tax=Penicillium macrosclerotiorum TaxID=303699 RepID=UPI0025482C4D|nr:uncharacterized protein N7462_002146 [Penicillium macrosclerotiorum]KAJ5692723.1 hypothetical protein N7462_002146 [Penicillium macrosclerotiorum]